MIDPTPTTTARVTYESGWSASTGRLLWGHDVRVDVPPPPSDPLGPRAGAAWSSWPQAARLLVTGATFRTSFPVALVVGTLLCAVNQGSALAAGDLDAATLVRMAANYAIPYVVSSIGFLSARRVRSPAG